MREPNKNPQNGSQRGLKIARLLVRRQKGPFARTKMKEREREKVLLSVWELSSSSMVQLARVRLLQTMGQHWGN